MSQVTRLTRSSSPSLSEPTQIDKIHTLFVANRGEIATRITRTCERLGVRAILPRTSGDGALDLLDIEAVVAAARAAGADAVHPGFGFLAENADFAEAVLAAGIRWVGPPPAAIRTMGDKAAARRLAASLGVPVIAGYDDDDQSDDALIAAAGVDRLPAARQAGSRWWRQGHADRPRARSPRRCPRVRPSRGERGIR